MGDRAQHEGTAIRAFEKIPGWLALGVAAGAFACFRLAEVNPTLRGESGIVFLAWWCGSFALLALAVPILQTLLARLAATSASRAEATSLTRGLALAVAAGAVIAGTMGIGGGALRWGVRGAVVLGVAVLLARARQRTPAWLEHAVFAVALAAAVLVPWRAAERIRANVPPAIFSAPPAIVSQQTPLLVIGLDGLEWRKLRPLMAAGRLPTFARLVESGATAPLRTLVPTWSPIVWNTLGTGLEETGHGVRDFSELRFPGMQCGVQRLRKDPALMPAGVGVPTLVQLLFGIGLLREFPITGCQRTEPAFWDAFSEAGGRVAVVSWYATWPAYPVHGALVSDNNPARAAFQATEFLGKLDGSGITEPPELLARLSALRLAPDLRDDALSLATPIFSELSAEEREKLRGTGALALFRAIKGSDEFVFRSAQDLLAKDQPALVAMYATGIDNVSHRLGKRPGIVDHYYEYVDGLLGRLLAAVPPNATLLIVSDHGWNYEQGTFGHPNAPDGVFLLSGPGVPAGELSASPHVRDVAPTVLALLGLPPSTRMRGAAVWDALPEHVRESAKRRAAHDYATLMRHPPRGGDSAQLQEETMDRLKALGYVE